MKHPKCRGTSPDDCGYGPSITCSECMFGGGRKDPRAACNSRDPDKGLTGKQRGALELLGQGPVTPAYSSRRTWDSLVKRGRATRSGNEYSKL
jgi:hypothetical protein